MYKINMLNKISSEGLRYFGDSNYQISEKETQPDAILVRSSSMHDMDFPASLKAIARAGAGVNNIPVEQCAEKGIVVFNTPGANANAVKELVIVALLISSRKVIEGIEWAKGLKGQGESIPAMVEKGKSQFVGPEIMGKKLGVIGLGAIGVMVANAASSLGMEVEGYDPYISVDAAWGLSRSIKKAASLQALIESCDYITLHVPLVEETKNMISAAQFAVMKQGARLFNFSREGLVDNTDLKNALKEGIVSVYVTDFPSSENLDMDNVIAIPHLGASTPESEENCAMMAVLQIKEFLQNGNIINSVNFPGCELSRSGDLRITVAHRNIPNMLGQVSTILANENINIQNMLNKSRGNYAYTIIDINSDLNSNAFEKLSSIPGVLAVRKL